MRHQGTPTELVPVVAIRSRTRALMNRSVSDKDNILNINGFGLAEQRNVTYLILPCKCREQ